MKNKINITCITLLESTILAASWNKILLQSEFSLSTF